jgi:hypothetical protein
MSFNDLLAAIQTEATCGEACWYAREDMCKCYCAGANHGCLRTANGERPPRTRRVKGVRFRMYGVMSWSIARSIGHKLTWPDGYPHGRIVHEPTIEEHIGKRHRNWPECQDQTGTILWVRERYPNERIAEVEAEVIAEKSERANSR